MGRRAFRFFLILCLLLMATDRVGRAIAIEPPALVPAKSAIVNDIDNLMLKYDLDQRRVVLLHDYNAWNRAALAFNREYTGRDLAKFPQLLAAGRAEQAQLARTLKQYNTQADTFRADVGKLRFKPEAARVIHGLCALAKRLGWSKAKLADLYNQLITLDSEKDPDVTPDQIRQIWQDIAKESLDADIARDAATGRGPTLSPSGLQTNYDDCAIFALSNAAGLPYSVVAGRAASLISQENWLSVKDRSHPQQFLQSVGLNGGEVITLGEAFGHAAVIPSSQFAATISKGQPVMVNVVPTDGRSAHEVVLCKTFQHDGETWYEMMDSYGPSQPLYLSDKQLTAVIRESGVTFRPNPGTTPRLLRAPGAQ